MTTGTKQVKDHSKDLHSKEVIDGVFATCMELEQRDLKSHEAAFVADLQDHINKYGERTYLTENQLSWLKQLATKYDA